MATASLEGRRLLLRTLEASDAEPLLEAVEESRAALKRRLRWVPETKGVEDIRLFIERAAAEDAPALVWGVFEAKSRRLAGVASLEPGSGAERPLARLGLWIRTSRQDKGLAAEAGRLMLEHAFRKGGMHRVYARLDPTNRAFRKVLKRLGFRYEGCLRGDKRLNGRWIDQECWGLLKSEWKK